MPLAIAAGDSVQSGSTWFSPRRLLTRYRANRFGSTDWYLLASDSHSKQQMKSSAKRIKYASPLHPWFHFTLEPLVQHVMQIHVRE